MTTDDNRNYWFRAKRHGSGWGFPVRWQGWAVIFTFAVLVFGGIWVIRPDRHLAGFFVYIAVLSSLLVLVCWLKGEKTPAHRNDR